MRRRKTLSLLSLALLASIGCSGTDSNSPESSGIGGKGTDTGGTASSGNTTGGSGGSAQHTGGSSAADTKVTGTAGSTTGGAVSVGGTSAAGELGGLSATGGSRATGGKSAKSSASSSGGNTLTGGTSPRAGTSGGSTGTGRSSQAGGSSTLTSKTTGGVSSTGGNSATGGLASTGGSKAIGGLASTGGSKATSAATGGATTGGAGTGGLTGSCSNDTAAPPSNVSAWIDESWNSELGTNIRNRQAWLLDNVMMGKGQINLCVRWGASTAPSAAVKSGMAAAVQKWMNDWFTTLDYGGFPYCNGVVTKVTGWAVKTGNTSWVSDLDSSIKIYTEIDAEGEPKCPDACSFFNNWTHKFPNCPGGEDYHTDYWLWLDDTISGGAAAVGGDWGLRMPVSNFVSAMGKSNLVIEHEMGHGFGFQDYYTWSGSTPTGGSLMIVGSTNSQIPTTGDQWLLRRTWMESKALRGW